MYLKVATLLTVCFAFGNFETEIVNAKNNTTATTVKVNTQTSSIEWIGKKILGQHKGVVNIKSGELSIKGEVITGGNFIIDMTSINCTDIEDADYDKKLEKHLRSTDFFNVDEFPTATLKITKVLKYLNKENEYKLFADLNIKGITKSISFPATFKKVGNIFEGNASFTIDRSQWDVR